LPFVNIDNSLRWLFKPVFGELNLTIAAATV
jgi:hypothetical protein